MPAVWFFHVLSKNLPTCIDATCKSSTLFLLGSCWRGSCRWSLLCLLLFLFWSWIFDDVFVRYGWIQSLAIGVDGSAGFCTLRRIYSFLLLPEKLAYKIAFRNDGNVMLITASWLRLAYNLLEKCLGQWLLGIFSWTFAGITGHVCFNVCSLG